MANTTAPNVSRVALDIETVEVGARFGRIFLSRYPDALGMGKTPSRFSDPRRRIKNRFGVLYLGSTLSVCFVEAILRDQRNGAVGDFPIEMRELRQRHFADIEVVAPLSLIDLLGNGPVRMGVPSDVARGARHGLARWWSLAFHEHPSSIDGIVYPSRLNGETNLALFDRAVPKLRVVGVSTLIAAEGLATVLNGFRVALVW